MRCNSISILKIGRRAAPRRRPLSIWRLPAPKVHHLDLMASLFGKLLPEVARHFQHQFERGAMLLGIETRLRPRDYQRASHNAVAAEHRHRDGRSERLAPPVDQVAALADLAEFVA